ncbi:unnamed protein product [Prorocentrum cordatum]|uniref:Beta-lactamase-related domain-containing protein n=1 Tax=Prorocentrum cordatum TaxID=2364126 RepID=A0ABN9TFU3_9DINO|nr:unnamed protein product [Polarella glacialis]
MRRVRAACVPAANLHCSARALARFYAGLPGLLGARALRAAGARGPAAGGPGPRGVPRMLLDETPGAAFGLGMRVLDCPSARGGEPARGLGHAGLGGSFGLALPELGLGIAVATNRLEFGGRSVPREVLSLICQEFGLLPPERL